MDLERVAESRLQSLQIVRRLVPWRAQLAGGFGTTHGNASLELVDVLLVLLAGFFNPLVDSQRLLEALSSQEWMQRQTGVGRIPRSTFSDALKRFDPEALRPLIAGLVQQCPVLVGQDRDLAGVTRPIVAADGSYFNLAGEVAWALACRRGKGAEPQARVRLNLQLDVESFLPVEASVSGAAEGSEAAAVARRLKAGVIYVVDRNFNHFGFIRAVLAKGSNLVLRLRKDVGFTVQAPQELSARDRAEGILGDDQGVLSGPTSASNQGRKSRTAPPPAPPLRRVTVWDPVQQEAVLLLTDLLDVPAYVVAALYRRRWQIELFFRWLKCWANLKHLYSLSPQGITLQFYVAVIATLLLHLATGRQRVSKYSLFWLASVASGQATWQEMEQGLARIEREKALEKARLARKKSRPALGAPTLPA